MARTSKLAPNRIFSNTQMTLNNLQSFPHMKKIESIDLGFRLYCFVINMNFKQKE